MDLVQNLVTGFGVALSWNNLLFCLIGSVLGTLIGVLPGVGPLVTISMLLPFTYTLGSTTAMIMLAGIFYGAQYGGSTTAILMRIPGEASSIVTSIDGYKMARAGRAGTALAVAAIGSFIAGTIATAAIAFIGPDLSRIAISFGPPEYFSLMLLGIFSCLLFSDGSMLNGLAAILLGLVLAMVGVDTTTGDVRYSFGVPELLDGIGFVPIAIGLFGLLEVVRTLADPEPVTPVTGKISGLMLTISEWRQSLPAMLRGTAIGTFLGVLPGGGLITAPFASYLVEKKISARPEEFGNGAICGVAGPEAANNAAAQTSFIPLLALGIPSNAVMALMLGALMVQGVTPGPTTFMSKPDLIWGLVASMWIGNLFLLLLNLPMVGLWARLATTPYRWLLPVIILCSCVGVYSVNNSSFDVYATAVFGLLGYIFWKVKCDPTPLVMAFVLGAPLEQNLRATLSMGGGSASIFVHRPISLCFMVLAVLILLVPVLRFVLKEHQRRSALAT
jgi:TctA family transporter